MSPAAYSTLVGGVFTSTEDTFFSGSPSFTTLTENSLEIFEPSVAVAVTVIFKPASCAADFSFNIPLPSISAISPPVLTAQFTF